MLMVCALDIKEHLTSVAEKQNWAKFEANGNFSQKVAAIGSELTWQNNSNSFPQGPPLGFEVFTKF